jgi:hypothetical protein
MKIPVKVNIERHLLMAKQVYKIETQTLRGHLINNLISVFKMASAIATGKFETHYVEGKKVRYTLKQREKWARVAGYTAQIIHAIAKNFDEHEVDLMLAEAERLIREAKQVAENQGVGQETSAGEGTKA